MADCEAVDNNAKEEQNAEEKSDKKPFTRRWCSVPMCKSRNYRSLHKFPRNPDMRKKWVIVCRIGKKVTKNMLVCRDHFLKTDFIPRWDGKLKRLKTIAIPSQNLPVRPLDKTLTPAQLKRKEDRQMRAAKRLERVVPSILRESKKSLQNEKKSPKKIENPKNEKLRTMKKAESLASEDECLTEEQKCLQENQGDMNNDPLLCQCMILKIRKGKECSEVRAARVLLELNELVEQMMQSKDLIFPIKDIMLKKGEEFYNSARRSHKITFYALLKNDYQLHPFTGIDFNLLEILSEAVAVCEELDTVETDTKLSIKEKIVLTLMKLKLNFSYSTIANLFQISEYDSINMFQNMIKILKSVLKSAIYWPTQNEIMQCIPECLDSLKKTIVVMDRTEVQVIGETCFKCHLPLERGVDKVKILLGFAQCGLISYVGRAQYDVSTAHETISDPNYISKILIPNNDAIMTHGVIIERDCNRLFIDLIKKRTEKPFDPNSLRVKKGKETPVTHIENAFQRFKSFLILQTNISNREVSLINDISVVICGIVNLNNLVVQNFNKNLK